MANTRMLEDLREMLFHELDTIVKRGELSKDSLDLVDKLTRSIKNVDKIMQGGSNSFASNNSQGSYDRASYGDGASNNSYEGNSNDGESYARRRYRRRYSYERGYSRHSAKEKVLEHLEEMLKEAQDGEEKATIMRCIEEIQD